MSRRPPFDPGLLIKVFFLFFLGNAHHINLGYNAMEDPMVHDVHPLNLGCPRMDLMSGRPPFDSGLGHAFCPIFFFSSQQHPPHKSRFILTA